MSQSRITEWPLLFFVHLSQGPRLATNSRGTNYCTLNSTISNVVNSANLQVFTAKTMMPSQHIISANSLEHVWIQFQFHGAADPSFCVRNAHITIYDITTSSRGLERCPEACICEGTSVIINDIIEGQFLSLPSFAISSLQPCSKSDAVGKLWQTYPLSWWMIHL